MHQEGNELPREVSLGLVDLMPTVNAWLRSGDYDPELLSHPSIQECEAQDGSWVFKLHFKDGRIRVFPFHAISVN